ncbi:hypothetical protein ABW19_dt0209803 [Dactylella cylindrospora]|nr:hypothetical protein ABW19_dt0209803 [Dactylella cylindrospora]
MLGLFESASAIRSLLFDSFPIKLDDLLPSLSPFSLAANTSVSDLDYYKDLDFDAYEYDVDYADEKQSLTETTLINYSAFDSYDWAFSFRESAKTEDKLVLEVSVERIPKTETEECDTYCLSTPTTSDMTLLHGDPFDTSSNSSSSSRSRPVMETAELISEEEQNMILAAILASQEDFDVQIPKHIREEMEHAEMVVAMEESAKLDKERQDRETQEQSRGSPSVRTPTREAPTPSSFNASPTTPRTPRSLVRRDSDIPWRDRKGEAAPGENEAQQRFREMLQFQAVQAASIANASARTGVSNITGLTDYEWAGRE